MSDPRKEKRITMNRIDAHAHGTSTKAPPGSLGVPYGQFEIPDQTETLLREMDAHGVEMSVLHVSHRKTEVETIRSAVRRHPTRFIGFCNWGMETTGREAAELIQKWLKEPEFRGVGEALIKNFYIQGKTETISGALNELRMGMDVVREKKVPILFHTGYSGSHVGKFTTSLAWVDPLALDEIAGEYSDVPIVIGHSGGHYPPYDVHALMMAYQHDNVYLETSKSRPDVIEKAVSEIGPSRIMFGTDWVREKPHTAGAIGERSSHLHDWNIKMVQESRISDKEKEMIFYGNIKSLLGL